MLLVQRIDHRAEKLGIAMRSTNILRRTGVFASETQGRWSGLAPARRQNGSSVMRTATAVAV
jgi:hypothetical protein